MMITNEKYDSYLLYEYMKKVSFTVRILVKLKEKVDPDLLNKAAQEAIVRLPYFALKVRVDENGRFLKFLLNPFAKDNYYYEIIIPTDKFMEYAKSIDGSPNTILAAFLFKMIARYFPAKPDEILSGRIADDYRNDIGANESYRDFTRLLHIMYTREMENYPIEKLNRAARGAVILQMQPELSCERYRQVEEIHKGIDAQPDLKSKKISA